MRSKVLAASPQSDAPAVAVILPGAGYTIQAPLLFWAGRLLAERGWHVQGVEWTVDDAAAADPVPFVEEALLAAFDAAPQTTRRLVLAKSFGCFALPWALREGVPGIWLTPVLTSDIVRRALLGASPYDLAIGGDADEMWLPDAVSGSRASILTVAEADHSLIRPGRWRASMDAQSDVLTAIEHHIDALDRAGTV
jgi:hypothetical protein